MSVRRGESPSHHRRPLRTTVQGQGSAWRGQGDVCEVVAWDARVTAIPARPAGEDESVAYVEEVEPCEGLCARAGDTGSFCKTRHEAHRAVWHTPASTRAGVECDDCRRTAGRRPSLLPANGGQRWIARRLLPNRPARTVPDRRRSPVIALGDRSRRPLLPSPATSKALISSRTGAIGDWNVVQGNLVRALLRGLRGR